MLRQSYTFRPPPPPLLIFWVPVDYSTRCNPYTVSRDRVHDTVFELYLLR